MSMSMNMNRHNIFEFESSYQQGGDDDLDLEGRFFSSDAPPPNNSGEYEMMMTRCSGSNNDDDDLLFADKFLSLASSSSSSPNTYKNMNKKFHQYPSTSKNDFDDFEWKVNQIFPPVVSFATLQNETTFGEPFENKNKNKNKNKKTKTTSTSDILQDALDLVDLDDDELLGELDGDFSNFTFEQEEPHHQSNTFAAAVATSSSYCQKEEATCTTNTNTTSTIEIEDDLEDDLGSQNYQDDESSSAADDDISMTMMSVDGKPSLDDSFQRLTKCMELTSQTREMIKQSGISFASTSALTTPARAYHSTPNLLPPLNNKTYDDSLARKWSHSPQRSPETRRKCNSNIALSNTGTAFQRLSSSPPCDSNKNRRFSTYESSIELERQYRLVDSSSVKRSGVAPRRFPSMMMMKRNRSSFPTITTKFCAAPQNVKLSLKTRKQLLTDLRRRKAASCTRMRLNRN